MLSKTDIQRIKSLQQKKFRTEYRQFIAEGVKTAQEVLEFYKKNKTHLVFKIEGVYATAKWLSENNSLLPAKPDFRVETISDKDLERISALATPNEVLIVLEKISEPTDTEFNPNEWVLALDGIRDPGNMGTIIRTAEWFGVTQILCAEDCTDPFAPKVIQSSMGGFLRVKIVETSLEKYLKNTPASIVYGTLLDGKPLQETDLKEKGIIIIGNESNGIRPEIKPYIQKPLFIPRFGEAESLNAAVATGIILARCFV